MQNILNFDVKNQDEQFKNFHKVRLRHSDYIAIYPSIYVLFIFLSRLGTQATACSFVFICKFC